MDLKKNKLFYKCLDKKYHFICNDIVDLIIIKIENNYREKLKLKYINKAKALYKGNKYRNYYNHYLERTDSLMFSNDKKENDKIKRYINRCNWYNFHKYGRIV